MLNNTNISNLIFLTNVFAADLLLSFLKFYYAFYSTDVNLLFLQPEVYSLHFLVWKGFYICYKYNFLY